jgi:hypothetical protein
MPRSAYHRRQVADLHVQQAALQAERRVLAARRIAQPGAGGIAAFLVLHRTVEHKDLLASPMRMRNEAGVRRATDQ